MSKKSSQAGKQGFQHPSHETKTSGASLNFYRKRRSFSGGDSSVISQALKLAAQGSSTATPTIQISSAVSLPIYEAVQAAMQPGSKLVFASPEERTVCVVYGRDYSPDNIQCECGEVSTTVKRKEKNASRRQESRRIAVHRHP